MCACACACACVRVCVVLFCFVSFEVDVSANTVKLNQTLIRVTIYGFQFSWLSFGVHGYIWFVGKVMRRQGIFFI